jgi:hypothetical protein
VPPPVIDSAGQEMVEAVVGGCDPREHGADGFPLGWRGYGLRIHADRRAR